MIGPVASERQVPLLASGLVRLLAFVAAVAVLLGTALSIEVPRLLEPYADDRGSPVTQAFEDRTGIRLVRVVLTGGGLVEVRYQVLDPTKAMDTFEQTGPGHPTLVDEATQATVEEPLMGMGHGAHANLKEAVTYVIFLENPGDVVQSGSTVTVVTGGARLEHVTVR